MAATETVTANGLAFACHRYGDGDRLALCLHGFPEDAGSLAPIAEQLADAGFTAVAPYMRGYGPTEQSPEDDYSVRAIAGDAVGLADTLVEQEGFEDVVLVGHDWGAVAGYAATRHNPERFEKLVAMAVPPQFDVEIWDHPRQFLRSWYVWFFQLPGIAEQTLRRNDFALIEVLWNLWSPGWEYDMERLDAVRDTFRAEGTPEAALQYYRQFVNPLIRDVVSSGRPDPDEAPEIEVPGLVVAGAEDGCIGPGLFENAADAFAADCRVVRVPGAGHFMHRERPTAVGEEVVSFLTS